MTVRKTGLGEAAGVGLLPTDRPHLMVAAGLALPVEKGLEVGVKKVVNRRRPAQVLEPNLHDDAPTDGPSYPSGHAAIATCGVVLAAPYLPVAVTAGWLGPSRRRRTPESTREPTFRSTP